MNRELHSILNGIPLINSNESQWSMRIQLDWMESNYGNLEENQADELEDMNGETAINDSLQTLAHVE